MGKQPNRDGRPRGGIGSVEYHSNNDDVNDDNDDSNSKSNPYSGCTLESCPPFLSLLHNTSTTLFQPYVQRPKTLPPLPPLPKPHRKGIWTVGGLFLGGTRAYGTFLFASLVIEPDYPLPEKNAVCYDLGKVKSLTFVGQSGPMVEAARKK